MGGRWDEMGDAEEVGGGMAVDGENMTEKKKKKRVHNMGVKKHIKTRRQDV
jgi:hypothetical protein